ncbi:MAG: hypothetical protein ABFD46_11255 [Armatimonadota bacterium]
MSAKFGGPDAKIRSLVPLLWAVAIVALASVPYIIGIAASPPDGVFTGFTFNIDDAFVYSSWIKQIANGGLFIQNQFTSDPQSACQFNLFFIALGLIARITHLSPMAVFHLARVVLGVAFLMLVWRFAGRFLKDPIERLLIVPVAGFSSGLGWMLAGIGNHKGPVDLWQPEAITFLSIYLNPLFLMGMVLMTAALHFLCRMKETGSRRDCVYAGFMLLLLGNIHTYDIVTVGAVWAAYLIAEAVKDRRLTWRPIGMSFAAALMALPSLGYQHYLYNTEEVFRLRAETPAPSPALWAYLMGYGLLLIFAVFGGWKAVKERRGVLMLAIWSIIGFAVPYLPVAQQRKLVMGLHIPLAILATIAIAAAVRRAGPRFSALAAVLIVAALVPSNLYFMMRDIRYIGSMTTGPGFRPYISRDEARAMRWLRGNTSPNDVVLTFPNIALFTPAMSGNRVYYGHWSETPDYENRLKGWLAFMDLKTPEEWRRGYLKESEADYVLYFSRPKGFAEPVYDLRSSGCARVVFESGDIAVYKVIL